MTKLFEKDVAAVYEEYKDIVDQYENGWLTGEEYDRCLSDLMMVLMRTYEVLEIKED